MQAHPSPTQDRQIPVEAEGISLALLPVVKPCSQHTVSNDDTGLNLLTPSQLSPGFQSLNLSLSILYPRVSDSGPQISINAIVAQQGSPSWAGLFPSGLKRESRRSGPFRQKSLMDSSLPKDLVSGPLSVLCSY